MVEILELYLSDIFIDLLKKNKEITTFHVAEFPGLFIKAMKKWSEKNDIIYNWKAQSMLDVKKLPPNKELFDNNKSNWLIDEKHNGDLTDKNNLDWYFDLFNGSSCKYEKVNFVSGDGGIDIGNDYDIQEQKHFNLFAGEIYIMINALKKNGCFLLKVYHITRPITILFIIILKYLFKNLSIIKPKTSKARNDEKYILCSEFNYNINSDINKTLFDIAISKEINDDNFINLLSTKELEITNIVNEIYFNSLKFINYQIDTIDFILKKIIKKNYVFANKQWFDEINEFYNKYLSYY